MQGWIKLHRKILENPISQKPHYAWLWVVLLLKANHEDNYFILNGKKQACKTGQILTGRKKLSLETGISEGSIERVLKYLENDGQIEQQKTNKFRLITVKNYKQYQKTEQQSTQQGTQQADTNKNVKNDKEYNISSDEPNSLKNLLKERFKKPEKKAPTYQWQDEALEAINQLKDGETKKSSVFKCFKDNPCKARIALNDCKELGKLYALYFLKIYNK